MKWFKPPRRRDERCDYCNSDKGGLAAFNNRVNVFCGPWCEAWFFHCRAPEHPPDQFEMPLTHPPNTMPSNKVTDGRKTL